MKGLYRKKDSIWWYYQPPTQKGQPRPKAEALRTQDYLEAVTRAVARRDASELQIASQRMTIEEILPRYLKDKAEHRKATRQSRERILKGFREILGNPRVDQINADVMAVWWDHLGTKGGSLKGKGPVRPSSKKSYLLAVKAFLNWCKAEGLIKGEDPLKRLRMHTRVFSSRVAEFHTEEERERVLAAAHDLPGNIKLILHNGYFQGLRDSEMLAMKRHWLWISPDGDHGTLSVQNTDIIFQNGSHGEWIPKGKRKRVMPMHPRYLSFIKSYGMQEPYMLAPHKDRWPDDNKKSNRFDAKKSLAALAKRAGVEKLNYHIMRHTFATGLVMKGVTLGEVAGLLGDSLKVTEDHYAGFSPSRVNPLAVL